MAKQEERKPFGLSLDRPLGLLRALTSISGSNGYNCTYTSGKRRLRVTSVEKSWYSAVGRRRLSGSGLG